MQAQQPGPHQDMLASAGESRKSRSKAPFMVGSAGEAGVLLHEGLCRCKCHQCRRALFLLALCNDDRISLCGCRFSGSAAPFHQWGAPCNSNVMPASHAARYVQAGFAHRSKVHECLCSHIEASTAAGALPHARSAPAQHAGAMVYCAVSGQHRLSMLGQWCAAQCQVSTGSACRGIDSERTGRGKGGSRALSVASIRSTNPAHARLCRSLTWSLNKDSGWADSRAGFVPRP